MAHKFNADGFYRDIIKSAIEQGWKVGTTSKNHLKFIHPTTRVMVITSGTASDHRSVKNFLGQMRRSGFIWDR
jgi:hypothetical protein